MFVEITKEIIFLQGTNGGRIPYANSLLINDEKKVLIDTGADVTDLKQVADEYTPDYVINTHFHYDHTRGNEFFPNTKIIAHPWEAKTLSSSELFLSAAGLFEIGEKFVTTGFYLQELPIGNVEGSLKDGDVLDFGKVQFQVIHTPGHTPGHLAFYCEKEGVLFAGDIDLTSFGPWYGNPASNIEDFKASIKKLIDIKPRLVLTGHGEPIEEGIAEAFERYLQVFEERDQMILKLLTEPKTLEELIDKKPIYRRHPKPVNIYRLYEGILLEKHLQRLLEKGLLIKEGESYWNPWGKN